MRPIRSTAVLMIAAMAGCVRGGSPGPAASGGSGPVAGRVVVRNRMTAPAAYAELEVAVARTVLPILEIDSTASVEFDAPAGTPLVLKWQGRSGIRTDTLGVVGTMATESVEFVLTDVGIIQVGKGAD